MRIHKVTDLRTGHVQWQPRRRWKRGEAHAFGKRPGQFMSRKDATRVMKFHSWRLDNAIADIMSDVRFYSSRKLRVVA